MISTLKKYNILFIVGVSILFNSCCKDKNPNLTGCQKAEPEFIRLTLAGADKYLVGKEGSYWIYKNTMTGDLDTQVCTGYLLDYFDVRYVAGKKKKKTDLTFTYNRLFYNITSSYNQWTFRQSTNEFYSGYLPDFNTVKIILNRYVQSEGGVVPFFYPFDYKFLGGGAGSSYTTLKSVEPTLNLNGNSFRNVAVFAVDRDEIWEPKMNCEGPNTTYYWAEDVGLIKRDMGTCGYAWELIEYNIIK